jgi:peroxiredoxin
VVIAFYRGSWCPYCSLELRALESIQPPLSALGATLLAISPENAARGAILASECGLTYPVLVDAGNRVARAFSLVHAIDPEVVGYQLLNGNDVAAFNDADIAGVPVPATYVADSSRLITHRFADADYTQRAAPEDVLEAVRRTMFTDGRRESARATAAGTVGGQHE